MQIRRLTADEWELHRQVRLRSLRDAPNSFADEAAELAARPEAYWRDLTQTVTAPDLHVMFLAVEGEAVCGLAYGLLDENLQSAGRVGGMWVDPGQRGQGLGRALLEDVIAWAGARGLTRLGLWAPPHESTALALYRQSGFRETGRRQPLPGSGGREIIEMKLDL